MLRVTVVGFIAIEITICLVRCRNAKNSVIDGCREECLAAVEYICPTGIATGIHPISRSVTPLFQSYERIENDVRN